MQHRNLTQLMTFAYSMAHSLGTWIVALIQRILPMAKGLPTLADPIGYLAILSIFVIITAVARRVAFAILLVGWALILIRVAIMAGVGDDAPLPSACLCRDRRWPIAQAPPRYLRGPRGSKGRHLARREERRIPRRLLTVLGRPVGDLGRRARGWDDGDRTSLSVLTHLLVKSTLPTIFACRLFPPRFGRLWLVDRRRPRCLPEAALHLPSAIPAKPGICSPHGLR